MREISFEEMQLVGGGHDNMCGWDDFGKKLAIGAVSGGATGAVLGSLAPTIGTVAGGIFGAIVGASVLGREHFRTCPWSTEP